MSQSTPVVKSQQQFAKPNAIKQIAARGCFPFDPGSKSKVKLSALLSSTKNADGDVVIDTGAGRGIKPTMSGLTNPTKSTSRIIWGDGTTADSTIEASLPDHDLPPFLVTPKAACTLVSVGSNTEGTNQSYSFFDKHVFRFKGLQVFKNKQGQLDARFVGPTEDRVKYIGTKLDPGGVYKAPSLDVFKNGENGAWRFLTHNKTGDTIIAGPPDTPLLSRANFAEAVDSIFEDEPKEIRALFCKSLQRPNYVEAFEYDVTELNAHQLKMATQLIQKHYDYGHASRSTLRRILQQSSTKSDRELARHVDLMPICNFCLHGRNKKGPKHLFQRLPQ